MVIIQFVPAGTKKLLEVTLVAKIPLSNCNSNKDNYIAPTALLTQPHNS